MSNNSKENIKSKTASIIRATDLPKATQKTHKGLNISEDELLELYKSMYLQRRFEERSMQMYQKGKFGGFLHLYIGQEAVSTGSAFALREDDDFITAYRDHGMGLVKGITPNEAMAELFGKKDGCSRGKGGSMHYFKPEKHFWGGHAIVGAHLPLAAGIAFANKYKENDRVTICFFGDGAVDQGSLNESFNLAQLWKLPVIYVVENNGYSMGTAVQRHSAGDLADRALPYGMKFDKVNGMDLFSMIEKIREVGEEVRKTQEPYFLEVVTYRYRGHSMSDPANYRTKEELDEYKKIDPIERLKTYVLKKDIATEDDLKAIDEEVENTVLEAVEFADSNEFPPVEELYKDVYAEDDFPYLT
ncbi:pyruvate dehydrogenase (acetyl-transferring) E1 component subunit alpha [Natronogracilivirga saccharolytica]|uniref:Pyruvate dehydrogenase E1 component subunit alpha n=1 Tax=Natronogracilivirga saccharolytica TaxID=2812953 RepID=A0A8J7UU55_9BACT|nr:pyruvate dehydrogenase (acetyl-transferring) E1 component subunit alpha [Natronogracilivirga saccharolytica]MBP3193266.1 pyruvate dehydrogenase (acetyl-transferring) E1 component subunit alpha [Natronogracilivirga saccharolytica]